MYINIQIEEFQTMSNNDVGFNFTSNSTNLGRFEFDFNSVDFDFDNADFTSTLDISSEKHSDINNTQQVNDITNNTNNNFNSFINQDDRKRNDIYYNSVNAGNRDVELNTVNNINIVSNINNKDINDMNFNVSYTDKGDVVLSNCYEIKTMGNQNDIPANDMNGNTSLDGKGNAKFNIANDINIIDKQIDGTDNIATSNTQTSNISDNESSFNLSYKQMCDGEGTIKREDTFSEQTINSDIPHLSDTNKDGYEVGEKLWKEITQEIETGFFRTSDEPPIVKQTLENKDIYTSSDSEFDMQKQEAQKKLGQESIVTSQVFHNSNLPMQSPSNVFESETNIPESNSTFNSTSSTSSAYFLFSGLNGTESYQNDSNTQMNGSEMSDQSSHNPFSAFFKRDSADECSQVVTNTEKPIITADQLHTEDVANATSNKVVQIQNKNSKVVNEFSTEHTDSSSLEVERSYLKDDLSLNEGLYDSNIQNTHEEPLQVCKELSKTDVNSTFPIYNEIHAGESLFQQPSQEKGLNSDEMKEVIDYSLTSSDRMCMNGKQNNYEIGNYTYHSPENDDEASAMDQQNLTENVSVIKDDCFDNTDISDFSPVFDNPFSDNESPADTTHMQPVFPNTEGSMKHGEFVYNEAVKDESYQSSEHDGSLAFTTQNVDPNEQIVEDSLERNASKNVSVVLYDSVHELETNKTHHNRGYSNDICDMSHTKDELLGKSSSANFSLNFPDNSHTKATDDVTDKSFTEKGISDDHAHLWFNSNECNTCLHDSAASEADNTVNREESSKINQNNSNSDLVFPDFNFPEEFDNFLDNNIDKDWNGNEVFENKKSQNIQSNEFGLFLNENKTANTNSQLFSRGDVFLQGYDAALGKKDVNIRLKVPNQFPYEFNDKGLHHDRSLEDHNTFFVNHSINGSINKTIDSTSSLGRSQFDNDHKEKVKNYRSEEVFNGPEDKKCHQYTEKEKLYSKDKTEDDPTKEESRIYSYQEHTPESVIIRRFPKVIDDREPVSFYMPKTNAVFNVKSKYKVNKNQIKVELNNVSFSDLLKLAQDPKYEKYDVKKYFSFNDEFGTVESALKFLRK